MSADIDGVAETRRLLVCCVPLLKGNPRSGKVVPSTYAVPDFLDPVLCRLGLSFWIVLLYHGSANGRTAVKQRNRAIRKSC